MHYDLPPLAPHAHHVHTFGQADRAVEALVHLPPVQVVDGRPLVRASYVQLAARRSDAGVSCSRMLSTCS